MNLDREVLQDLLPLVASGTASPATVRLVRAAALEDRELAARMKLIETIESGLSSAPPDAEDRAVLAALRATRRAMHLRGALLGFALFGTLLPFSFGSGPDGVRFLFADRPVAVASIAAVAAVAWLGWLWLTVRLRRTEVRQR